MGDNGPEESEKDGMAAPARRALIGYGPAKWIALGTLVALFVGAAWALVGAFRAETDAREQIVRTSQVVDTLSSIMQSVLDAETGRRGYLLTGGEEYLSPFEANRKRMPVLLDRLAKLIDSPDQLAKQRRLAELHVLKLKELEKAVELTKAGGAQEALLIFDSERSRTYFAEMRSLIGRMREDERAALQRRVEHAEQVERRTLAVLGVVGLLSLGIIFIAVSLAWRAATLEARERDVAALREAHARSDLLARELNHRVKNLFSVILSIIAISARHEADAKILTRKLRERVHALASAHAISQGDLDRHFSLRELIEATTAPYGRDEYRLTVAGPDVHLPTSAVTPLGLILHELATNATKYGAWSIDEGEVHLEWTTEKKEKSGFEESLLQLRWKESGGPVVNIPEGTGFGTRMVNSALLQLNGESKTDWLPSGLVVTITLPIPGSGTAAPGRIS